MGGVLTDFLSTTVSKRAESQLKVQSQQCPLFSLFFWPVQPKSMADGVTLRVDAVPEGLHASLAHVTGTERSGRSGMELWVCQVHHAPPFTGQPTLQIHQHQLACGRKEKWEDAFYMVCDMVARLQCLYLFLCCALNGTAARTSKLNAHRHAQKNLHASAYLFSLRIENKQLVLPLLLCKYLQCIADITQHSFITENQ